MENNSASLSKDDLIDMLKAMIENIDQLPRPALLTATTHYDLQAFMILVLAIFRSEKEE